MLHQFPPIVERSPDAEPIDTSLQPCYNNLGIKEQILVVEDETSIAAFVQNALEREGFVVRSDGGRSWAPILDQSCDWLAASEVALYCGAGDDLFISSDKGQSWKEVSDNTGWRGPESLHFAVAPGDPQTLYGGANAVMKSTDGGWTWADVSRLGAAARMRLTVDP